MHMVMQMVLLTLLLVNVAGVAWWAVRRYD